ncbi:hypothetical protein R3P38DRAFT_2874803 [Favolaschia claudopus]|uniref:Secreted protein n=1 Tax=Favolaschia claudopus TaxID=2862362 RepID=A0AAW0D6J0_9AGAR
MQLHFVGSIAALTVRNSPIFKTHFLCVIVFSTGIFGFVNAVPLPSQGHRSNAPTLQRVPGRRQDAGRTRPSEHSHTSPK